MLSESSISHLVQRASMIKMYRYLNYKFKNFSSLSQICTADPNTCAFNNKMMSVSQGYGYDTMRQSLRVSCFIISFIVSSCVALWK